MSSNTIALGQKVSRAWQSVICSEYLVLFLTLAYFVIMLPLVPGMGSEPNLANLLSNMLPLLVVAVGQQFVLIGGGIDLSVTSTIALASVTGAFAMNGDTGWVRGGPLAVLLGTSTMLGTGAAVGIGQRGGSDQVSHAGLYRDAHDDDVCEWLCDLAYEVQ